MTLCNARFFRFSLSRRVLYATWAAMLAVALIAPVEADEINIYSARHYDTDMALYQTFTERTGIQVNLIEGSSDALIERLVNEGAYTRADMLITVDAGRLWRAAERDILQPIESEIMEQRVPEHLRHPDGLWFGLSKRARVIAINKDLALGAPVTRYEDLAREDLRGRVCMRSSSNIYNLSLMASLIAATDNATATAWAETVVANFARNPQGNDTAQLRAVASGECGLTIANTYYLGRLLGSAADKDNAVMANLSVIFPNQDDRGTHINISGAGITKHAPNRDDAIAFLEYLTSPYAQRLFAEGNNEYPVIGDTSGPVAELGAFVEDDLDASQLGVLQTEALMAFDRAGWP